jgi:hypothetical protein
VPGKPRYARLMFAPTSPKRRNPFAAAAGVLVAFGSLACGSTTREVTPTSTLKTAVYIGGVDGTDARIALVRDEALWAAYVCGGATTLTSLTEWFQGEGVPSPEAGAEIESHGKRLRVTFSDGAATGSVVAGDALPFSATRVPEGTTAGLYELYERGCRSGLIVPSSGDGAPQGVHCATLDATGASISPLTEQVNPLSPLTLTDRGIPCRVPSDAQTLYLTPVVLPLR